jgi:uncharacterized protein YcnI
VEADDATAGSFSVLTFRVPNESDTAGTVKLAVTLPNDTPFLSVSTKPVPGWKATATEAKLAAPVEVEGTTITKAVRTVTWTADRGVRIGPGEFQEFAISVGPLPAPKTIVLPAEQTYSDGTVVSWTEATPASGQEPEYPAPEFSIAPAAVGEGHGADTTSASPSVSAAPPSAVDSSDTLARVLGGLGLVAGVAALAVALVGRRRGPA